MIKFFSLFILIFFFVFSNSYYVFAGTYCFTNNSGDLVCTESNDSNGAISNFDYSKNSGNTGNTYNGYSESLVLPSGNPDNTTNTYNYNNNGIPFSVVVGDRSSDDSNGSTINSNTSSSNNSRSSSVSGGGFENVNGPDLNCYGLPGCANNSKTNISNEKNSGNIGLSSISNLISQLIQFVAVFAVFALVVSGIMYLISLGDEEKAKRAKKWIIWALAGVILSITAWGIISMLNKITIG